MNALVTMIDGEAVTTSLAIAEGTEVQHKNVLELIRTYQADLQEFGRVAFETAPFETAGGTQQREIAKLNEQQSTLLLTLMRNSEIVVRFKVRLVKAFFELAQRREQVDYTKLTTIQILQIAMKSEQERLVLEHKVEELAPKAEALDRISAGADTLTLTEAAKVLGIKRNELTVYMHANSWVYRQNGSWLAYDKYIKNGCLQYKEAKYTDDKTGQECIKPYCHILPKGLARLAENFTMKKAA